MTDYKQMIEQIREQLGSEGTREMAVLMFERMEEQELIQFDPVRGYTQAEDKDNPDRNEAVWLENLTAIASRDLSPGHWGTDDCEYFRSAKGDCWLFVSPGTKRPERIDYIPEEAVSTDTEADGWMKKLGEAINNWAGKPSWIADCDDDEEIATYTIGSGDGKHLDESVQFRIPIIKLCDTHGEVVETIYLDYAAHQEAVEARAWELLDTWRAAEVFFHEAGDDEKTWLYATDELRARWRQDADNIEALNESIDRNIDRNIERARAACEAEEAEGEKPHPAPFRFVATYQGETLGYFDTQEEAEAAIDAARTENEEGR